jgi:hypothetical protein
MVQGSGFSVQSSEFSVHGSEFRVQSSEFRVQGSGFRVEGSEFRVQGSEFGFMIETCAPWLSAILAMAPTRIACKKRVKEFRIKGLGLRV